MRKQSFFTISLTLVLTFFMLPKESFATNPYIQKYLQAGKEAYRNSEVKKHNNKKNSGSRDQNYDVGDDETFWRWDFTAMPPTNVQEDAVCMAVGDHSYIFVSEDAWDEGYMDQDDVDLIFEKLENSTLNSTEMGIVEMDSMYFGDIPDVHDDDPRVIFYFTELGSYGGSVFDGYFSVFNQMTEEEANAYDQHSNEMEMLYMSCYPVDPTADVNLSILAHELQHLIHWGADEDEDTWVDEGCAEYAMVLYGYPDPLSSFPNNSNNSLLAWNQEFSDYVKTQLFFTYLSEHFGGSDLITNIVSQPANSVDGLIEALDIITPSADLQEIINSWAIANVADDLDYGSGIFGYNNFDMPNFSAQTFSSFPINNSASLYGAAAKYFLISESFEQLNFTFNSSAHNNWVASLLFFEGEVLRDIVPFTTDGSNTSVDYPQNYTPTQVRLAIVNTNLVDYESNYEFSITSGVGIEDNYELGITNYELKQNYPNPFNPHTRINYELAITNYELVEIVVYNAAGQKVWSSQLTAHSSQLTGSILFDGSQFNSGIYYYSLVVDGKKMDTKSMILIK